VARPAARFLVQAGAFADAQNAQALRERLLALDPALPVELREELVEGQALTRVLIGQLDSWLAAETVRRRLQANSIASLVRQLPGQPLVAAAVAGPPAAP
jgi:rare lipoprotein A